MNNYIELFIQTTELPNVRTVCTFDHIFSVPPLRIIDGHNRFKDREDTLFLLWDINHPTLKRHKTELCLDGVFLNTNEDIYRLFDSDKIYAFSNIKDLNTEEFLNNAVRVLDLIFTKQHITKKVLKTRYLGIVNIYKKALVEKTSSPADFYKCLLINIYNFLGFHRQAISVREKMYSLFESGITTKYISELIRKTINEKEGLISICANKRDIFDSILFRSTRLNDDISFSEITLENASRICELLENGKIVPCQEIVTWSLALAGLSHIGNDHGVSQSLQVYLKSVNSKLDISMFQASKPNEDGANFIKFSTDVYQYKPIGNKLQKVIGNPSRSMNIFSAYLHIGKQGIHSTYENFLASGEVSEIKFGEISL